MTIARISAALTGLAILLCVTAQAARQHDGGRLRIRFDADWRFQREPPASNKVTGNLAWSWSPAGNGLSLDVDSPPTNLANAWRPARIGQDVFGGRPGYAWFRADLGSDPADAGKVLHFESVDDDAVVFLNGKKLLRHEGWDDPFEVPVKEAWKSGSSNELLVLVRNGDGPGGIMGSTTFGTPLAEATPAEVSPGFSDAKWRTVHLPHDFVVEGTFTPTADAGHGSLPTSTAWYRKTFTLPAAYQGKSVWIDFDGAYRNSKVWLNGHLLGQQPSGYIGFRYDIGKFAKFGGRNVLSVHVDATKQEGWWYEGGGIYRHVWLNVANPIHVAPLGSFVHAAVQGPEGTPRPEAVLTINTSVIDDAEVAQPYSIFFRVVSPHGAEVGRMKMNLPAAPVHMMGFPSVINLHKAELWSIEHPNLYRLETSISRQGTVVDRTVTTFGVRTIRFDVNKGFFLNGKPVKLKGTCNHQDHAGVGIAMTDGLLEWRIRKLKEMGSNAYRCSHNPPAPELLDACDRLGMVVMDENRHLGDTASPKSPRTVKADDLSELESMILRDRNHPSIVLWSMCNEENIQTTPEGTAAFAAMKKLTHDLDPSRPVTAAINFGWDQGIGPISNVIGFNYNNEGYDGYHKRHPNQPMFGSETASTVSTRGIYKNDARAGYVSAYDLNAPPWAKTAEVAWKAIAERDFMAGSFVWTGFDYKGEPTPYGWPCINSHFGILDICGFPKDNYYYYKAWWGDQPIVHILPHWTWTGKEGQPISVWAYANADRVELFLNGKSLGSKVMPAYEHVEWQVRYVPGVLVAKAYRGDKLVATDRIETTGAPASIRLKTTRARLVADDEDLAPVEVEILDAKGRVVPTAGNRMHFSISGAGEIGGVGNGDPSSHEPDKASQRSAFNGRCIVLVRAKGQAGRIELTVTSPGLKPADLTLKSAYLKP